MTCEVDGAALVRLLEQFASVKRAFGNQSVVILLSEIPCRMQGACNDTHCLELCSRVADGLFVNRESLCKVLVCNLLEAILICNLTASDEQSQGEIRRAIDPCVESRERVVHKLVQSR